MPHDLVSLLLALTVDLVVAAVALAAVMPRVNRAVRDAQTGAFLQAAGWVFLLSSRLVPYGGWADRSMSTLAMLGISGGLAFYGRAYEFWCGRSKPSPLPTLLALLLAAGYCAGFSHYAFRVGWANGLAVLQMLLVAASLARRPTVPVGRWRWLLLVALLAQAIVTGWRGIVGVSGAMPSFAAAHPVNFAFALTANVTMVLSLVGVLLAHRDEASRELLRQATHDGLTGVLNRRAWMLRAETEFAVSTRYGHPMAVLMIDIDHFKQINDTLGHAAGDRALEFVGRALQSALRAGDQVARYGGEEFCVLMSHADQAAALAFDRRMRGYLAEAAPRELGHPIGYSAGITMKRSSTDTLTAMLKRADDRLYAAKAQGRGLTLHEDSAEFQRA